MIGIDFIHILSVLELIVILVLTISSRIHKKELTNLNNISLQSNKAYIQSLKNTIYSERYPILERLIAFKEYIKNGGNGNCKNYALSNLLVNNRELWLSVLNNDNLDDFTNNKTHYLKTLNEIEKTLQ